MLGTQSIGIPAPIYRGDGNIFDFICNAIMNSSVDLDEGDILGITESLVARSQNNYCTVDDIAESVRSLFPNGSSIYLLEPIASRNRFSLILKGIAKAFKHVYIIWQNEYDEVGNYIRQHPFTEINYYDFYTKIVEGEGSVIQFAKEIPPYCNNLVLDCHCHPKSTYTNLSNILQIPITRKDHTTSGYNPEYGILGSNVAGENRLKLFPRNGNEFVIRLQNKIRNTFGVKIDCLIYGDGCFKDPVGGIWEFADPITCPGSTIGWEITPVEAKLKLLAESYTDADIKSMIHISKQSLGTTPRRVNDLLASLMDLTSGSGDKGTPIVLVKKYFTHYGME